MTPRLAAEAAPPREAPARGRGLPRGEVVRRHRRLSRAEREAVEATARVICALKERRRRRRGIGRGRGTAYWEALDATPEEIVSRVAPYERDRRRWKLLCWLALARAEQIRRRA